MDRRRHVLRLPAARDDIDGYPEVYVGFNAGDFSFKQWYSDDFYDAGRRARMYTEANYTHADRREILAGVPRRLCVGRLLGRQPTKSIDYAVQGNYDGRQFHDLRQVHRHRCQRRAKITDDVNNNEPRFLVGVMTTFPWGD